MKGQVYTCPFIGDENRAFVGSGAEFSVLQGMSRFARVVVPGLPLHVVHRGNQRGNLFFNEADRLSYLDQLALRCERHELELWAYCLMTNHVHLLVLPHTRQGLAKVIAGTHQRHAARINLLRSRSGHLWENRYFSTVLDEAHLWAAVRYVERNPVRAGLVRSAEDYPWSSAAAHCVGVANRYLSAQRPFPGGVPSWRSFLAEEGDDHTAVHALRTNSKTGWPTGSPAFVADLEARLDRRLSPLPVGPKPR